MATYHVYRHGMNGANQHLIERLFVGQVEADDAAHAERLAYQHTSCYHNQWFEIVTEADQHAEQAQAVADEARWSGGEARNP